jgi:hypothetical protein
VYFSTAWKAKSSPSAGCTATATTLVARTLDQQVSMHGGSMVMVNFPLSE